MDELKNVQPLELGGTGKTFIDADTLVDKEGQKYRIQGVDAAEVEKVVGSEYKQGTAGGAATTDVVHKLATEQGYTNTVPLFNADGTPQVDHFGRQLTDLVNENGESFKTGLLQAGAFDVNKYTTEQDIAGRDIAEARRRAALLDGDTTATAFDLAAADIKEAELGEGAKQQGFKQTALNEAERARYIQALMQFEGLSKEDATNKLNLTHTNQVQIRRSDRDINNIAKNPFSDSWEQGWTGVGEAAYGVANLLGVTTENEGLAQWGQDGVDRQRAKLAEYGSTILDYKEVDGIGAAFEYLGNNLALSLPQMGFSAAAALTAPITGGLSLSVPSAIYTGQTWNEMEGEKNAAVAIGAGVAQAALDKLGLDFIFKKGVAPQKLMKQAVNELTKKGVSKEIAEQTVVQASRKEIAAFAGDAAKLAKQQITAKAIGKDLLRGVSVGGAGEAVTEAAQESTAYLAAVYGSDKEFSWDDLNNRLISAAIAGGTLGGGLAAPSSAYNAGAWADVAYRLAPADAKQASLGEKYAALEKSEFGRVASVEELAADARARSTVSPGASIDERAGDYKTAQKTKGSFEKLTDEALNVSQLWQGATRNIFTPALQEKSRSARVLADMFGGNLQKTFSGASFENSKHHRVAVYKNMVSDPRTFYEGFTGKGGIKASRKGEISDGIYSSLNAAVDKNGKFDARKIPNNTPNKAQVAALGKELNQLSDRLYADQKKHNKDLGYVDNYLFKYKALSKKSVAANRLKFQEGLVNKFKYSPQEARQLVDEIIDNPEVNDVDEAFSVVKGGISPQAHKSRSLNLSEQPEFQEFFEKDLFANVNSAVKSAARYTAHRDYIGENGSVVSKLLDDMQAEGVPQAEVNKVAAQMKNYLDAESGNYKRPSSDAGKSAQRIQKNFMMFTTMAGLPLATISSFVEIMLINKGLRKDQIFGKTGSLRATGKELANTLWDGAGQVATAGKAKQTKKTDAKERIKELGFYEWDVGAATVTGVSETNPLHQQFYEEFFKWTGLSGYTNFTRAARASLAGDYLLDKADVVGNQRRSGSPRTREVQEAEEGLRNLGIDVDQYVELQDKKTAGLPLTKQEEAFFGDTVREATFNFVNEAIALPQAANRPLIYQDPRFALFTQFQGFIATFTANHIPKLWGEYVKRGTPAMKYNAFALATTMIMMGFVSQYLKDLIKYGGSTPHLEGAEYLQRGIRASGLLGTGERVLDQFFPIYEQKTDGVGDWVFKTGSGESPALSTLGRLGKSAGKFIEGDVGAGVKYGLKSSPIIGPFSGINEAVGQAASKWNFRGG